MKKKQEEPTMGLLGALMAATLGANGVDENRAIEIGRKLSMKYGNLTPTEESVRRIIRDAKVLRRPE